MPISSRRILVVSQSDQINIPAVSEELASFDFQVFTVQTPDEAHQWMTSQGLPHLIVLDFRSLTLEKGMSFAEEIYGSTGMPIVVIGDKNDDSDLVQKAMMFADDFVRPQFAESKELVMRIRRVLSRTTNFIYATGPKVQITEDVRIDTLNRKLEVRGETHLLTPIENALLSALIAHRGQILDAATLIETVWRVAEGVEDRNALRVHIHRLRNKIESDPDKPRLILTNRGIGYSLADD